MTGAGPLAGLRVVELGGIGPVPFCGMVLADSGADVVRIDPPAAAGHVPDPVLHRGRRRIALDLKRAEGLAVALDLIAGADALLEGFRPGVAERLGLGPEACLGRHPRLVYGRMTGFGQDGPLAQRAGHDINYIALSGALAVVGRAGEAPTPPANLVGDFGGGGMLLAFGVVSAVLSARGSGRGQVVDASMVDGSALLLGMLYARFGQGAWQDRRGVNLLDTGAPFYDTYRCADGGYVAVGALEPAFYANLLAGLDLAGDPEFEAQHDRTRWPAMRSRLAEVFATRSRDAWAEHFHGVDACVTPVLSLGEAPGHPHNTARGTFLDLGGVRQPAPAPRFGGTPAAAPAPAAPAGHHTRDLLAEAGRSAEDIERLFAAGVVR
jgi:alpha-methylacyl-CoA racemase